MDVTSSKAFLNASVAQLVAQRIRNAWVAGSSPAGSFTCKSVFSRRFLLYRKHVDADFDTGSGGTMKYNVLVADDEYIIRRGIIRFVCKYEELEIVAEAEDGEAALEMLGNNQIHLAFVDINMPFLNGLGFIRRLKELSPETLVVIITGYDDFEYAREAIRLNVFEYLLKPVMEQPFDEMIKRVLKKLNEETDASRYLDWARQTLEQNKHVLAADFLEKWLDGHLSDEEARERIRYLDLKFPENYLLIYVHLQYRDVAQMENEWDDDLLYYATQNIGNEIYNDLQGITTIQNSAGDLIAITADCADAEEKRLHFKKNVEKILPVKAWILQEKGTGQETFPEVYRALSKEIEQLKGCSSTVQSVKDVIERRYREEDFSLMDAAEELHLSPQHLSRLFHKEMGITFIDYLTRVRIRKAIDLFYQEDMKMYEIAENVGYATQHYFSSVFKKNMGVSPAEYRKSIKSR